MKLDICKHSIAIKVRKLLLVHTVTSILRLLQLAQISQALSYGNDSGAGPSMVIISRSFSVLLDKRLRRSVLTRERAEKPRSQSTLDIGNSNAMVANLARFGNIMVSSEVLRR